MSKIIKQEDFLKLRQGFRDQGKTVVLCHGVFDLLHYGHIEHLREAKSQGDILVVSITASQYVNKGPDRPYFNDQQRMSFLSCIEFVDYVMLSEGTTVHDVVEHVQPDVYVKGQEYADSQNDVTGNIDSEREIVERYGGHIYFTRGEVYSSTRILNNFFGALPKEVVKESKRMHAKYGDDVFDQIRRQVDAFSRLKILVVGDIIIDEYVFCRVQGVTMKDGAISTLYESQERYRGGSMAVAQHLANFAGKVTLLSQTGTDSDLVDYIIETMSGVECRIVQQKNFVTPIKRRYLKRHPLRHEYDKLFSINYLMNTAQVKDIDYGNFNRNLRELILEYDVVVVCDYGHGLLQEESIRLLENEAPFLVINVQANSSNYGTNVITKYRRADAFAVDERELNLAFGQAYENTLVLLKKLREKLNSTYACSSYTCYC